MSPKRGNGRNNDENTKAVPRHNGHNGGSSGGGGRAYSARQFASSNSTVNTFLGGKQKSWMIQGNNLGALPLKTAPSKVPGPKPTTAGNSPPLGERGNLTPSASTSLQQSIAPLPTPQPPSNSTSPLIANTLHPRQNNSSIEIRSQEVVLPSPAPSEEAFPDFPGQSDINSLNIPNDNQPLTGNPTPLDRSGRTSVDIQSRPGLGQELNELVSRYGVEEVEKLLRSSNGPQNSLGASSTPTSSTAPAAVESLSVPSTRSISWVPSKRPSVPSMAHEKRQRVLTVPSSAQTPVAVTLNSALSSSVQPVQPMAPNVQSMIGSSLKYYLPMIDKHISASGGENALGQLGVSRIRLLQDACRSEDCFYITLHQVYCLHSLSQKHFLGIPGMTQVHIMGLGIVEQLILSNEALPPNFVAWFATFPSSHSDLVARSPMYLRALKEVQNFLSLITQHWQRIKEEWKQRGYPPLVEELVTIFGLVSVVFQRIVFTAVHRSIWGNAPQDPWFRKVELLFRHDQQNYQQIRSRMNSASPPTLAEIRAGQDALVSQYVDMYRQQQRQSILRSTPQSPASMCSITDTGHVSQNVSTPVGTVPPSRIEHATGPSVHPPRWPPRGRPHMASAIGTPSKQSSSSLQSSSLSAPSRPPRLNIDTQPGSFAASPHTVYNPHYQNMQLAQMAEQARILAQSNIAPYSPITLAAPTSGPARGPVPPPQPASQPSRRQAIANQPLIPTSPFVAPLQPHATLTGMALHQAHLRSPTLYSAVHAPKCDGASRFYSVVGDFALAPKAIDLIRSVYSWSFEVSDSDIEHIATDLPSSTGAPARRNIFEGSRTYRLRCAELLSAKDPHDESEWVIKDNIWPSHAFLELNSSTIELRRKHQHGKDLPADLTPFIAKGVNQLKLSIIRTDREKVGIYYALSVEVVEVITGGKLRECLTATGHIPAEHVLESIKASLSVKIDDEDIAVVNSNITIQLTDPYTARIFDTPIRSKACLHRECFDLDTFLQTRKSKRPEWPCMPDEWKCPICGSDARPQVLRIDGFLMEVRASLAKQNLLDTRAIIVEEDGSWQPKAEKQENDLSVRAAGSATPAANIHSATPISPPRQSVVIDLEEE
ncbi:MAG: hypothetical protein M1835_002927 [Candelina submexicana]|nr:MAG: hypothetical protein M1835_002927 [Candelina submexicana]